MAVADLNSNHASPVIRFGKVTTASKNYWFSLIQLYEIVGNEDALKGIWCSIGESKVSNVSKIEKTCHKAQLQQQT